MSISINCSCGKVLAGRDADAGRRAICPNCGKKHTLPGKAQSRDREFPQFTTEHVRRIENWVFAWQKPLWVLAIFLVVALVIGGGLLIAVKEFKLWQPEIVEEDPAKTNDKLPLFSPPVAPMPADSPSWATNFATFAEKLAKTEKSVEELSEEFTGVEIRWEVTFATLHSDTVIYFSEAAKLTHQAPPFNVWATLLPNETHRAQKLHFGDKIILRGRMGTPAMVNTPNYPNGIWRIGPTECVLLNTDGSVAGATQDQEVETPAAAILPLDESKDKSPDIDAIPAEENVPGKSDIPGDENAPASEVE